MFAPDKLPYPMGFGAAFNVFNEGNGILLLMLLLAALDDVLFTDDLTDASEPFLRFGKAFDGTKPISTLPEGDRPYESLLS